MSEPKAPEESPETGDLVQNRRANLDRLRQLGVPVAPVEFPITATVSELVRRGLEEARGNYKIVARLFNMEAREYKRFLNFLRKHDCQLPFKEYR